VEEKEASPPISLMAPVDVHGKVRDIDSSFGAGESGESGGLEAISGLGQIYA